MQIPLHCRLSVQALPRSWVRRLHMYRRMLSSIRSLSGYKSLKGIHSPSCAAHDSKLLMGLLLILLGELVAQAEKNMKENATIGDDVIRISESRKWLVHDATDRNGSKPTTSSRFPKPCRLTSELTGASRWRVGCVCKPRDRYVRRPVQRFVSWRL